MAAIERLEKKRRLGDAIAMRLAHIGGKPWQEYVKKLKG